MSSITLPPSLDKVQITSLPDSAYYISSFITPSEEEYLLNKITSQPLTSWRTLTHRRLQVYPAALTPSGELRKAPLPTWLEEPLLSRLLSLSLSSAVDTTTNITTTTTTSDNNLFTTSPHQRPNHILINEYPPGIGIAAHEDGAAYFPLVATVSLAGHTVLDIHDKDDATISSTTTGGQHAGGHPRKPKWRILQERRSLLVTTGEMYERMLHGIADVERDCGLAEGSVENWGLLREETRVACGQGGGCLERELRISATMRDVVAVRDYARFVPGLGGRR